MVFSSLFFLFCFLPVNLLLYYSTGNSKLRNLILVIFSLFFYAWGEPIWVSLLIISSLVDFINGIYIEKYRGSSLAKLGIISTLVFNLGILFTFKYADFITENVNFVLGTSFTKPGFLLPIGISFYTFQTISYTIDVYKGEVKAQRSFLNFLLFVSLFHQLVAGPIVRYSHIASEIENRSFQWSEFSYGIHRFCKGLFKKVCIANIAGETAAHFLDGNFAELPVMAAWFGIVLYSLQIYFDFSGYSDMAIGLGRMFGFHYHENFNYPYIARSVTDFWRRWHISLSSCFRDYLYIPLGGNRKNAVRNILVVWAFTGLWHGASWNFVLWGLYFGILLLLEKYLLKNLLEKLFPPLQNLYAMFLVVLGWALFYFTDLNRLFSFLQILFGHGSNPMSSFEFESIAFDHAYWLMLALLLCTPVYSLVSRLLEKYAGRPANTFYLHHAFDFLLFGVSVSLLVGSSYNPFIYFRF
jgi:alginate O-acetyltransferase complex protein AlgI